MLQRVLIILSGTFAILASSTALAVEPLSAERLSSYCLAADAKDAEANAYKCEVYVKGFLDGAIATDERVASNIVDELERDESFSERAIRTRMSSHLRSSGPTYYAEFCVGNPVPIAEVIGHVVEELTERESLATASARNIVYAALRRHYPCEPDA